LAAVPLVERQPIKLPAVPLGASQQLQSDLRLRPIVDLVRDVRFPAAFPVGLPRLGQEQFAVEKGLERAMGYDQMDGDDPVGHLARAAEVLPLHARRLGPFLQRTGLVENANRAHRIGRQLGDRSAQRLLNAIGEAIMVPQAGFEKLLQTSWWRARILGQWLSRLAVQVGKQPAGIVSKVLNGSRVVKKPLEGQQKSREFRADGLDLTCRPE